MKIIEEAISKYGKILDGEIIKVDSFVNHQVNPGITNELARYFVDQFKDTRIDKVLTLETSGIPIAYAVASILSVSPPLEVHARPLTTPISSSVSRFVWKK